MKGEDKKTLTAITRQKSDSRPADAAKERLTVHLPVGLIERVKNAVYWTPGLTLAGIGEAAFSQVVEEMESKRGAPFPRREAELKGGRPMK